MDWLFSFLLRSKVRLVRVSDLEALRSRRLELDDLSLKPNQYKSLRSASSEFRQALYDCGEHYVLTQMNETARKAVIGYRIYLMRLTKGTDNEIKTDRTPVDDANDRMKQLLSPRNGKA